jgi:hypothetical protein
LVVNEQAMTREINAEVEGKEDYMMLEPDKGNMN